MVKCDMSYQNLQIKMFTETTGGGGNKRKEMKLSEICIDLYILGL